MLWAARSPPATLPRARSCSGVGPTLAGLRRSPYFLGFGRTAFSSRVNSRSTASRMNAAIPRLPTRASMRLRVSADSRITILSRFNGGRPMRGGLYDFFYSSKVFIYKGYPLSLPSGCWQRRATHTVLSISVIRTASAASDTPQRIPGAAHPSQVLHITPP
jgi:hypothetical protein